MKEQQPKQELQEIEKLERDINQKKEELNALETRLLLRQCSLELENKKKEIEFYREKYTQEMIDSLLSRIKFKYYHDWWDIVFLWVDGKRPFGNSNIEKDIDNILWLSNEKSQYIFWEHELEFLWKIMALRVNDLITNK